MYLCVLPGQTHVFMCLASQSHMFDQAEHMCPAMPNIVFGLADHMCLDPI